MKISKPLRLSPSSINTFFRCSLQFQWTYLLELEPDEDTDNLFGILGKAFHKAMELDDLYNITPETLRKYWRCLFYVYLSDSLYLKKNLDYNFFLSRGYDLLSNGLKMKERWKENSTIVFNEKYYRISYPNKFIEDVYFSGRMDLVVKNSENIYTIIDWKTGTKQEIDDNIQMSFYIYYIHKTFDIPYENIYGALAYPLTGDILFTQRKEEDVLKVFEKIDNVLKDISIGNFIKNPKINKDSGNCIFCPHPKKCKGVVESVVSTDVHLKLDYITDDLQETK